MLIKKDESVKFENSKNCTVFKYNYLSDDSSFATAKINGRYPDSGKLINQECEQVFFVISGTGKIFVESNEYSVKEGDLVYIKKGEKYSVEGNNLSVAISNYPKWTYEQYKNVEK